MNFARRGSEGGPAHFPRGLTTPPMGSFMTRKGRTRRPKGTITLAEAPHADKGARFSRQTVKQALEVLSASGHCSGPFV